MNTFSNIKKRAFTKKSTLKAPDTPGIYIYFNKNKNVLYIGKAINLRNRINSYRSINLDKKTKKLINETKYFSYIQVVSEIEALLLEAKLIRKYKPQYNVIHRDDKRPLYIKITNEKYPRILTARKIEEKKANIAFFGPFPSSGNVKNILRLIRKIYPYSDHSQLKRPCLHSQIGLCNPCPGTIENIKDEKEKKIQFTIYKKNIKNLKGVLEGKIKSVRNNTEKQMKDYSKRLQYEKAENYRKKIELIDYITQPITPISYYLKNPNLINDIRERELDDLFKLINQYLSIKKLNRIECYDVSHMSGVNPAASMVTFISGEQDKSLYRHFKIRQKRGADDTSSLEEIAKRRSKYFSKWGIPNLIIVDGGKGQVSSFKKGIKVNIPTVGIAKRTESLVIPIVDNNKLNYVIKKLPQGPAKNLVQRLRNEAHRFSIRYHSKLVKKDLFKN